MLASVIAGRNIWQACGQVLNGSGKKQFFSLIRIRQCGCDSFHAPATAEAKPIKVYDLEIIPVGYHGQYSKML